MINSYKDLIIWQKGIELTKEIYLLTEHFPKSELFGLTSQMRRSCVSIPSNIAEGRNRGTRKDFINFLRIAYGSLSELETQIIITKQLNFSANLQYNRVDGLIIELGKMFRKMLFQLKSSEAD